MSGDDSVADDGGLELCADLTCAPSSSALTNVFPHMDEVGSTQEQVNFLAAGEVATAGEAEEAVGNVVGMVVGMVDGNVAWKAAAAAAAEVLKRKDLVIEFEIS